MSSSNIQIKKGDKIVDYGRVFNVFKISKTKAVDNKLDDCIHYKSHFPTENSNMLECSLPKSSLHLTNIRKISSKADLLKALRKLKKKMQPQKLTTIEIEEKLKQNDLFTSAKTVALLWATKKDEDYGLTTKNKMLMEKAIESIAEELALAQKISLKKAKEKILQRLNN